MDNLSAQDIKALATQQNCVYLVYIRVAGKIRLGDIHTAHRELLCEGETAQSAGLVILKADGKVALDDSGKKYLGVGSTPQDAIEIHQMLGIF